MSRFIESIRLEHGRLHNMQYHNARANRARKEILGCNDQIDLRKHIPVPAGMDDGLFKCRVLFDEKVLAVEIEPYVPQRIQSLQLVDGGTIDYAHKYADRSAINLLFAQRGPCDDILIIKDGLITDTSYANVAFLKSGKWVTPATPLLPGTKRQELLDQGLVTQADIRPDELINYTHCLVFNALRGFDVDNSIPVSHLSAQKS